MGHLSLSSGQSDSIREFCLKFSDSNFKSEGKINSKKIMLEKKKIDSKNPISILSSSI